MYSNNLLKNHFIAIMWQFRFVPNSKKHWFYFFVILHTQIYIRTNWHSFTTTLQESLSLIHFSESVRANGSTGSIEQFTNSFNLRLPALCLCTNLFCINIIERGRIVGELFARVYTCMCQYAHLCKYLSKCSNLGLKWKQTAEKENTCNIRSG